MKSEYRAAFFSSKTLPETAGAGFPLPNFSATTTFKPLEQTVSTSLVYRFNWGGPVVAKY